MTFFMIKEFMAAKLFLRTMLIDNKELKKCYENVK